MHDDTFLRKSEIETKYKIGVESPSDKYTTSVQLPVMCDPDRKDWIVSIEGASREVTVREYEAISKFAILVAVSELSQEESADALSHSPYYLIGFNTLILFKRPVDGSWRWRRPQTAFIEGLYAPASSEVQSPAGLKTILRTCSLLHGYDFEAFASEHSKILSKLK